MVLLFFLMLFVFDFWLSVSFGIGYGGIVFDEEESGGEMGKVERVVVINSWGGRGIFDEGIEVGVEVEVDIEDKVVGVDCIG